MSTTYFVAELRCPHCGAVSPADTSTGMSSKLLSDRGTHMIRVGDRPCTDRNDFAGAYLTLRMPESDALMKIIELWYCEASGELNWALVTFRDGLVESVESVMLTRALLDSAHFLTENVSDVYESITGESLYGPNGVRPDFAVLLRSSLPE